MWILILTLSSSWGNSAGVSIHSISGFKTETACLVAGTAWMKGRVTYNDSRRALCVRSE